MKEMSGCGRQADFRNPVVCMNFGYRFGVSISFEFDVVPTGRVDEDEDEG